MSGEYTPTTDDVFDATVYTWVDWKGVYDSEEAAREGFNRWFARVRAEAQIQALREVAEGARFWPDKVMDRHDLNEYADRIAREAGIEQEDEG